MGYVIEYDYDYKSSENCDYNYDYRKKCNRLHSITIAVTITPALIHVGKLRNQCRILSKSFD